MDILYKKIEEVPELAIIARELKKKFVSLASLVRLSAAKGLNVSDLKFRVRVHLTENRNTLIQHHINALDRIDSVEKLFDFLIDNHFIGYLNYTLLKEISDLINDSELKEKFDKYEEEYRTLLRASSFHRLMEVFKLYPELSPTTAVGLPEAIFYLDDRWTERTVYTWQEYFAHRFFWANLVIVKLCESNSILITYAILPSIFADVMRDLTNPAIIAELKDNGVTIVQLPQEKGIV